MADDTLTVVKSDPLPTLTVADAPPPAPTFWDTHPNTRRVVRGALDTLPAVGGMTGAALAAPETVGVGSIPAAVAGTATGRLLRDQIAEAIGVDSPTSPLSKAGRIALDSAITAVVPIAANRAKVMLANPKATLGDILDGIVHPMKAADDLVAYLRASPSVPASAPWSGSNAEPVKLPDGSWSYKSLATGEPLAEGETANVFTKGGKTFTATVPAPIDPAADLRQAELLINSGSSPSEAASKVANGNASRFSSIMASVMKSRMVK
jgi:hypothetical protein